MKPVVVTLAAALALGAMSAEAGSKKERRCDAFGAMSDEIAVLRKEGLEEMEAVKSMAETHAKKPVATLQVIPYLASFIYGLKPEQLDQNPGTALAEQCKAQ